MLIKRRQVEYWKSQFTDYNLKGVDNTSRSLFQSPTRIEIPVCFELALMSIFSLLSIVNTFGFVDPGNNWSMYWLSLLVDNPSIHFPTAISLATVLYKGIFGHIHCMRLGCATITPYHPSFRIYLDSRLPSLPRNLYFTAIQSKWRNPGIKGSLRTPSSGRRLQEILTTLRTMTIPRWDLKTLFRLISLPCSFK